MPFAPFVQSDAALQIDRVAKRYGGRPSDYVFDKRPDAYVRLSVDMAVASRAQAEEAAYYRAEERKRGEEPDGGKNRKEPNKDKPLGKKVLTGEVGEAVSRELERKWIELGGRPLAVEAKDKAKRDADFATYIAARNARMSAAPTEGQGGQGHGTQVGAPAEGQP